MARAARRQLGLLRVTPSALPLLRVCETRAAPWQLELVAFRPVPCGAASTWVQPPPALWGYFFARSHSAFVASNLRGSCRSTAIRAGDILSGILMSS